MAGNEWNYNPGVDLKINQWAHVAGTFDGESIKIFLNGELIESKTAPGKINWDHITSNYYIGSFKDFNENNLFNGQIDEIRIWNIARSSNEIKEFRTKKLSGKEEGLLAYYTFDQDQNLFIQDFSPSKINGQLNIPAQEQVLVPSGAMIVPRISKFEVLTPASFKLKWETSESIYTYDYYEVEVSTNKSFDPLIANEKTLKTELELKNIQGGSKLYTRIKAFSKDIGYTAYSDVLEISEFSTALSLIISALPESSEKTINKLIDYNILTGSYIGLPKGIKDIQLNFKLNSKTPENISPGLIRIEGPRRQYETTLLQNTDLPLFDLEEGKYKVEIKWETGTSSIPLTANLVFEIKEGIIANIYLKYTIAIIALLLIIYFLWRYRVIPKKKMDAIKLKLAKNEQRKDWIDTSELEKQALHIRECIIRERLFLDPKFNLKSLAEKVNIPHYQISKILNDYFDLNFNDFINEFRVNEFIRIIRLSDKRHIKNSALAFQCGFYSESTFFRAFKKFIGKTPQQYIKDISGKKK